MLRRTELTISLPSVPEGEIGMGNLASSHQRPQFKGLPRLLLAVALTAACAGGALAQSVERPVPDDPLALESGRIDGKLLASGVKAYFGIPFAAPPVGSLRWREPQPVKPWQGVLHADRFAPECIQALRAHDINHYFGEEPTSEDCLYLNVWVPPGAKGDARRPVAVWIYGGGFTIGSAAMANYRGESLARKGLVYVTIGYRVGALGFLSHPALTAESPHHTSGNQGFLDQIAALQWVRRNIEKLGGDPANVTIMGQSAGSMSVSVLQASPLARGLFHRVIGMSGGVFGSGGAGAAQSLAAAQQGGPKFEQQLKVDSLASLRSIPADRILQAQAAMPLRYGPVIDGYLLPAAPSEIFAGGKQNDVPTLIGFTHDESFSELGRATTLASYRESAQRLYGDKASQLLELYPAKDDVEARSAAVTAARDSSVALQMHEWARAQSGSGKSPVYVYLFARVHPYAPGVSFSDHDPKTVGAYHTGDVPYWLGTLDSLNLFRTTRNWSDFDRKLADTMSAAIVAFATTGNPNADGSTDWPAYRADREQIREFGDTTRVVAWPNQKKLDFFAANTPAAAPPATTPRGRD
jgi:para-nitrobenzyl esterase